MTAPVVAIAEFPHLTATTPRLRALPWPELARRLSHHTRRTKKDGPGWSPTIYPDGATRSKDGVVAVTAVVLDCDEGPPPWGLLAEWTYAAHTTFQHTPQAPRWRVVLPLAAPILAGDWPDVWERARYRLCPTMDESCKDAGRFYWWPTCLPDATPRSQVHDGRLLTAQDLPALPPAARPEPATAPAREPRPTVGQDARPGDAFAAQVTWERILAPHGWKRVYQRGDEGHWRRPGKREGTSATTNYAGSDVLYVFSSNAPPFAPGASYTKFGAYAVLEYDGDHAAAARALSERGLGRQGQGPGLLDTPPAAREARPLTNFLELEW